jgi:hypothetical protein
VILPGQKISEGFKACIWLNALPPSMEITTQSFLSQPKVDFDDIYQALVRRYESTGPSKRSRLGSEVAHTAIDNGENYQTTSSRKTLNTNSSSNAVTCNFCKKKGHIDRQCYKRHPHLRPNNNNNRNKITTSNNNLNRSNRRSRSTSDSTTQNEEYSFCLVDTSQLLTAPVMNVEFEEEVAHLSKHYETSCITQRDEFILDSGASKHIVFDRDILINVQDINPIRLTGILKQSILVNKAGSVQLSDTIKMSDVACVVEAGANLISVSKIFDAGFKMDWSIDKADIVKDGKVIMSFTRVGGIYVYLRQQNKRPPSLVALPMTQKPAKRIKSKQLSEQAIAVTNDAKL